MAPTKYRNHRRKDYRESKDQPCENYYKIMKDEKNFKNCDIYQKNDYQF